MARLHWFLITFQYRSNRSAGCGSCWSSIRSIAFVTEAISGASHGIPEIA